MKCLCVCALANVFVWLIKVAVAAAQTAKWQQPELLTKAKQSAFDIAITGSHATPVPVPVPYPIGSRNWIGSQVFPPTAPQRIFHGEFSRVPRQGLLLSLLGVLFAH